MENDPSLPETPQNGKSWKDVTERCPLPTKDQAIERRRNENTKCPYCNSEDYDVLDADIITATPPDAWEMWIKCRNCAREWHEVWFY